MFQGTRVWLDFLRVRNDLVQPWIRAQEAISKWQRIRTGTRTLLQTFGKLLDPDLDDAAILDAAQGFGFCFGAWSGHGTSPHWY